MYSEPALAFLVVSKTVAQFTTTVKPYVLAWLNGHAHIIGHVILFLHDSYFVPPRKDFHPSSYPILTCQF